ncbi:MAG: T9SS type A sorting domain-containing protein [Bacteroidales bacterium]
MKNTLPFFILTCCFALTGNAQNLNIEKITGLSSETEETSGLLWVDGSLWTHNDSGNPAVLYKIDTSNGSVSHRTHIKQVRNTDWEDLCADQQYVYIGDFGNNNGNRTDLCIYRIDKSGLINESDSLAADSIQFHYPNQSQFEWDNYSTNFDCEAMIAFGDSLYLFSKNWGNQKTYLYSLPKTPGSFAAHLLDSLDVDGLVTGAAADTATNNLMLLGYSRYLTSAFVYHLYHFFNAEFFAGERQKYNLGRFFHQLEGIEYANNTLLMSSESFQTNEAALFRADFDVNAGIEGNFSGKPCFYPNPAKGSLQLLNCQSFSHFVIRDIMGREMMRSSINSSKSTCSITCLQTGTYILEFHHRYTNETHTDLLLVE